MRKTGLVLLPALSWLRTYDREVFIADMIAAVIVAIMLIPQSLAYALLAGLPPEVGLYASIVPLIAYALFGTSSTLSVGPVAITSLMTAAALGSIAAEGSADYLAGAITLAVLSGILLVLFGLLRLGFLANFLSHSVVSAFISASAIIIALSQFRHVLGVEAEGDNVVMLASSLWNSLDGFNTATFYTGGAVLLFLFLVKAQGVSFLTRLGLKKTTAQLLARTAPVLGVVATIIAARQLDLEAAGVALVGVVPQGLPGFVWPDFSLSLVREMLLPAVLISIIGYVESISVGRTLGGRRRERVNPNQELVGLGAANIASGLSGAFPVTGGFSRSVVNFDAGARTQAASIFAAIFIGLASVFLTPYLYYLPNATLAATIIVAVVTLMDIRILPNTWRFSRGEFLAVVLTLGLTLVYGVETGVSAGVIISLFLHVYRTSAPHIAEVGQVAETEHFRNVKRFHVSVVPQILSIRVDEALFFANINTLEELIYERLYEDDRIAHVILLCSAINGIDYSALEVLEELNRRLQEQGVLLHLSELKGPVHDRLARSHFLQELSGRVYLSHYLAVQDLSRRYGYTEHAAASDSGTGPGTI